MTATSNGAATTEEAKVALFTGTIGSGDEYSLVLAPALRDEVQNLAQSATTKRDLEKRILARIGLALLEILGPHITASLMKTVVLAAFSYAAIVGELITLGPILIPLAVLIKTAVDQYSIVAKVWKDFPGGISPSVVVLFNQAYNVENCPKTTPKCSSCNGEDIFVCKSGDNTNCKKHLYL